MVFNRVVSRIFFPFFLPYLQNFFRQEEQPRPFVLHACLRNSNEEIRFLQTCSRVLVFCLLPSKDIQSLSLRIMLAEILTTKGRLLYVIDTTNVMIIVQTNVIHTNVIDNTLYDTFADLEYCRAYRNTVGLVFKMLSLNVT